MGSRERRAHRTQQKQQSLGGAYQGEQRTRLPAPTGANFTADKRKLGMDEATYIDNAIPDQDGLLIGRAPTVRAYLASVTTPSVIDLVAFQGTTSASNQLFGFYGNKIFNVGEIFDTSATATCSAISAPGVLSNAGGRWTQRNGTLIYLNGRGGPIQYDVTNGWHTWTATVSGQTGSRTINNYDGITQFKSRLYAWDTNWSAFAYSTVDAIKGTLEFFNLAYVMPNERLWTIDSMTRDGGSGPDDFFVAIGEFGTVVVYQGSNPGSDFSLVGKYQIGRPLGKNCTVKYGSQLFVLCEDDVYVLPQDLQGKRAHSNAAYDRRDRNNNPDSIGGVYWPEKDIIVWSDSTTLSVKDGYKFTQTKTAWPLSGVTTNNMPAHIKPSDNFYVPVRNKLSTYERRLYAGARSTNGTGVIYEILPSLQNSASAQAPSYHAKIITRPFGLSGRTSISLVNPVFAARAAHTTAGDVSTISNVVYRTAVVYDQEHRGLLESSASAGVWVTTSASSDSKGLWTPGFGTGDMAQIHIEVLSASTSADLILKYIDVTFGDTGGL